MISYLFYSKTTPEKDKISASQQEQQAATIIQKNTRMMLAQIYANELMEERESWYHYVTDNFYSLKTKIYNLLCLCSVRLNENIGSHNIRKFFSLSQKFMRKAEQKIHTHIINRHDSDHSDQSENSDDNFEKFIAEEDALLPPKQPMRMTTTRTSNEMPARKSWLSNFA